MPEPDLSVLSPAMLDHVYNQLLEDFTAAKDADDADEARVVHLQLLDVIAEYASRTDVWIAAHAKTHATP